jgi:hypothetical protein
MVVFWINPAYSEGAAATNVSGMDAIYYSALVEQYLENNEAKGAMLDSQSENLRNEAARSLMKTAFVVSFRQQLIREMAANDVTPKAYAVNHYINGRFYEIVRADSAYAQRPDR